MDNSVLDFKIDFNLGNSPKDLEFTDTTKYSNYGISLSKVTGNLKMTSPSSVFYINAGFVSNDFSNPDIDADVSLVKSWIKLPVTSNGEILCGTYKFEYNVKVDYGFKISDIANNKFQTLYTATTQILQSGNKIEIYDSTTGNNGIYTVTSVVKNMLAGITIISVAETIPGGFSSEKVNIIYTTSKTIDCCFVEPIVKIEVKSDCSTSILTSEDLTEYKVSGILPIITRTHTIIYPIDPDTGVSIKPNVVGSTAVLTAGPNIYTGMWTINISSDLVYKLNNWFTVNTTVKGQKYHNVKCSLCMCLFFICYKAVYEKYKSMIGYNVREAERLTGVLLRIVSLYQLYQLAVKCGYDTDYYCTEIKTILNTENCTCDTEANDDVPVEVIPISGGGGGTTVVGSVWYNGTGVPSPSLGSNGDYYLDNATGNVYYLTGGVWTITTNIFGSNGANGSVIFNGTGVPSPTLGNNGDYYIDTATNDLYFNTSGSWNIVGNIQGTAGSVIFNGTGTPSPTLGNNGDYYIDTATNDLYFNTSGSWSIVGNIQGAAGANGVALLHNDVTVESSSATNLEEIIKTYTLSASTMSDGDMIEIETILEVADATPSYPIYYRVRFGGLTGVILNLVTYTNIGNYMGISLKLQIIKVSDTLARVKIFHNNYINSPNIIKEYIINSVVDFTIANDIVITSENTKTVPVIGDVIVRQFTIKLFKL